MFPRFFQLLTTVKPSISHLFNSLRVPFFLIVFLSFALKIPGVLFKPPKPFIISLNKISPFTQNWVREFSKHIQWDHQNSAHILNNYSPNPCFSEHLPQQNLTVPLQGGTQKITVCPVRHKKHPSLRCSASMAKYLRQFSSRYGQRNVRSIPLCLRLVGLDHFNKNPAWFLQRPKYRFSNIETCPKGPNYRYAEFFWQSHRWAKSPRSRIKILISKYY